jgi:hypothetical protein
MTSAPTRHSSFVSLETASSAVLPVTTSPMASVGCRFSGTWIAFLECQGERHPPRYESRQITEPMKSTSIAATRSRPNRILVALAAAWMILSLAIGGAVADGSRVEASTTTTVNSGTLAQP